MRDITIGQYYPEGSVIHRLDPRTKLMGTLVYIVVLFLVKNPLWYLVCLGVVFVLYKIAKVPFSYFLQGLRGIAILLIFTFFFRMVCTPGTAVAKFWIFVVTQEGIHKSIRLTSRIALMITGASLLSYTTTPRAMADGLEKSFSFLEKVKIPIHDMAVIVMIAFRFIPIMIEETNALMDAQAARGAEFEHCSVMKKCKNVFSLLMPLFLSSVRRSSDLAMAMEARGYGGDRPSSRMYPLVYQKEDKIAYLCVVCFFVFGILVRVIS